MSSRASENPAEPWYARQVLELSGPIARLLAELALRGLEEILAFDVAHPRGDLEQVVPQCRSVLAYAHDLVGREHGDDRDRGQRVHDVTVEDLSRRALERLVRDPDDEALIDLALAEVGGTSSRLDGEQMRVASFGPRHAPRR